MTPIVENESLAPLEACQFCGGAHLGFCPRLAEIQYYPNGTRRSVKFHAPPAPPKPSKAEKDPES